MPSNGKNCATNPIDYLPKNVKFCLDVWIENDFGNYQVLFGIRENLSDRMQQHAFLPVTHDYLPILDETKIWDLLKNTVFYQVCFLDPDNATKRELSKSEVLTKLYHTFRVIYDVVGFIKIQLPTATRPYYDDINLNPMQEWFTIAADIRNF